MLDRLGWIGFGEAASCITKGLKQSGLKESFAFDINTHSPKLGEKIQSRASDTGTVLLDSNADLADKCDVIISAVTADQAPAAATQTAAHLTPRHTYADLNSISPQAKEAIAKTVEASGAKFVEIAVMGPVPPYLHKVPMLLGGPAAPAFASAFQPIEPMMADATVRRMDWAASLDLKAHFGGEFPKTYKEVLDAIGTQAKQSVFEALLKSHLEE